MRVPRMIRRQGLLAVTIVVGAIMMLGAAAFACMPEATVELDREAAAAGETVEGTGQGFRPALPVEVHFQSPDGTLLWAGNADTDGAFTFSFEAPDAEPGHHVIYAFHENSSGDPARAVLEITSTADQPGEAEPAPAQDEGEAQEADQPAEQPEGQPAVADDEPAGQQPEPAAQQAPAPATADQQPEGEPAAADEPAPAQAGEAEQQDPAAGQQQPGLAEEPAGPVTEQSASDAPIALAFTLLGLATIMTLGAGAWIVAQRREQKAWVRKPGS